MHVQLENNYLVSVRHLLLVKGEHCRVQQIYVYEWHLFDLDNRWVNFIIHCCITCEPMLFCLLGPNRLSIAYESMIFVASKPTRERPLSSPSAISTFPLGLYASTCYQPIVHPTHPPYGAAWSPARVVGLHCLCSDLELLRFTLHTPSVPYSNHYSSLYHMHRHMLPVCQSCWVTRTFAAANRGLAHNCENQLCLPSSSTELQRS